MNSHSESSGEGKSTLLRDVAGQKRALLKPARDDRATGKAAHSQASFGYRHGTVLAADVVGYSRLMEAWELRTYTQLRRMRKELFNPAIEVRDGKVVKNTGDGFLAVFDNAHQATDCALYLQRAIATRTREQPSEQRIMFRMAVHISDYILDDEDIHGDGVNIAARLQTYAPSGGIIVSEAVAKQIIGSFDVTSIDLGELQLRNISEPVRVFELRIPIAPAKLVGDAVLDSEQRPSLAVLPFRMHLASPDEAYFADGVVDDIIHSLASLKELFVVSRGSALGYGGVMPNVKAIGQQLGVRYVLYGSVQRTGGCVRIRTELSDTESGTVIDTRQHGGDLDDLFELQDRIAISVVKNVAPNVQERELRRARRKHPQDMNAYDLVLQALDLLYRMDYESFCKARGLLQQAISYDPSYAPAYYHAAIWHVFRIAEIGSANTDADTNAATALASSAIERDKNDGVALSVYGHVQSRLLQNYSGAAKFLDRALDASPNLAMTWAWSSINCGYLGFYDTAVEHAEQGVRLSPLDIRSCYYEGALAQAHYLRGSYEEALFWARSAVERNEALRFNLRTLIVTLVALHQRQQAYEVVRQLLRVQPDFRLRTYIKSCPFKGSMLDDWIMRLKSAGVPE